MSRSALAVIVGLVIIAGLSLVMDWLLMQLYPGMFTPRGVPTEQAILVMSLVYVTAFVVSGSYVAARMAPAKPVAHALALGILCLAVLFFFGGPRMEGVAGWYRATLLLLILPGAWVGGYLRAREIGETGDAGPAASYPRTY